MYEDVVARLKHRLERVEERRGVDHGRSES
jgi:hypothetical protein